MAANEVAVQTAATLPWREAFVSFGVLALCLAARHISLPSVASDAEFGDGRVAFWSIMALGVRPVLSGYMVVEFAALLVPAWRPLRVGGPAGRARLHQAALILGMLIAVGQAVFYTLGLESSGLGRNYGAGFRVMTVLTLVGATAVLVVLARIVDREGLGNGFSILLLAELVPQTLGPLGRAWSAAESTAIPWSVPLSGVFVTAVLAGATLWMFSSYCLRDSGGYPHPSLVSRPACGVVPLNLVAVVPAFAAAWARLRNGGQTMTPQSVGGLPASLLLGIGAAGLFAFLFNRPDRIREFWKSLSPNPSEGIPRLKAVMVESVLFVVLVALADAWAVQRMGSYAPNVVPVLLATGIICDLVREWRAREKNPNPVPVWEIHQNYAVAPTMRLLEAEGIRAFAKGLRLHALLQFFGPYVPIRILVPAGDAQRAYTLLRERWPGGDRNKHSANPDDIPNPPPIPTASS